MRSATVLLPLAGLAHAMVRRSEQIPPMPRDTGLAGAEDEGDEMPLAVLKEMLSPVPTQAPKPRWAATNNLFGRADEADNTCGYVHYYDDPESDVYPITCADGYLCTNVGNVRDCCSSDACSTATFSTACLDADDCPSDGPDAGTFCCTFSTRYPYCVSYLWSSSTDTADVYTLLNCRVDTESRIGTIEAESTSVSTSDDELFSSTASGDDIASTTSGDAGVETVIITDGGDGNTNTGDDENSDDGGSNTGAIVGGVVGGVGAIGIGVLAAVWFIKKKKNKNNAGSPGIAETKPDYNMAAVAGTPSPGPGMTPSPAPQSASPGLQYAPHQSIYGGPGAPISPQPTGGYPSPMGSPQPYGPATAYNNMTPGSYSNPGTPGTMFMTPGSEQGMHGQQGGMMPQMTGHSGMGMGGAIPPQGTGQSGQGQQPGQWYQSPQQTGQIAEAPADNAIGTHGNRAELG